MGIRILNYWLILAQSEVELLSNKTLILSHLERLGFRVNFAKSALSPSQRVSFLGTVLDSAHMRAVIAPERALAIQKLAATFKSDTARPLKVFQRMLGLMAAASPVLQLGLLRMRPPSTLVETTGSWRHRRLHIRVNQACVTALTPWKNPQWMKKGVAMGLVHTRKVVTTDASNTFGHWSKAESGFHINCLEMLAVCRAFGKAEVDLFASKDNSHCPTYYLKDRDALAHDWPNLPLYAFPPIALLPQVVRRIREQGHKVLLVAPLWRNQPWLSELTQLQTGSPLSGERDNMAPSTRVVGSLHLAAQQEPTGLSE